MPISYEYVIDETCDYIIDDMNLLFNNKFEEDQVM
jgi:hypothetical protein